MASNCSSLEGKYIYDTPYSLTRDISLSLDADKGWEQLGKKNLRKQLNKVMFTLNIQY